MISIVIASYNQREYLCEAIESCLNQTYKIWGASLDNKKPVQFTPIEIIVVDDGSTDGSLEIARLYEPNIKVISQVNKGLASARNTGIMNARYDYVLCLDADDILLEDCIEKITNVIEETNADIIAPSFKNFGLNNNEIILGNPTVEDFKSANRIGYCSAIKREALLAIGGYSPRMIWGAEDYHLWFNLLSRGYKLVTIPEILWLYRVKEQSMWTETAKHKDEFMAQIIKDFPEVSNE
jgi:glycosyltransferase involved in cell wall biosynthesis